MDNLSNSLIFLEFVQCATCKDISCFNVGNMLEYVSIKIYSRKLPHVNICPKAQIKKIYCCDQYGICTVIYGDKNIEHLKPHVTHSIVMDKCLKKDFD